MATLILSVLFWMGLRWEEEMNTPRGDRWLLMIAFVIGLSFGVHFMGLLTIPALGMIYYFKNYKKITIKGFIYANLISIAILLFIFKLLLPLTLSFFGLSTHRPTRTSQSEHFPFLELVRVDQRVLHKYFTKRALAFFDLATAMPCHDITDLNMRVLIC